MKGHIKTTKTKAESKVKSACASVKAKQDGKGGKKY